MSKTERQFKLWETEIDYMEIPSEIKALADASKGAGYKAYLVGGCVRDFLMGIRPKDWDIATDATPEEIQRTFPESVYENTFGTVSVKTGSEEEELRIVEITTFRKEGGYADHRHPDKVEFTKNIEEDLARRDFTMNAIAMDLTEDGYIFVDPYGGQTDIQDRIIRAVGKSEERFEEDALRMMRAVRFASRFGFQIEEDTQRAIAERAGTISEVAPERVRDELIKLLMTKGAVNGVRLMLETGLLDIVIPELAGGAGVEQNKHHAFDIFEHNVRSLAYTVEQDFPLHLRLAALLHDVAKTKTREWKSDPRGEKEKDGKKGDWTFYQHQYLGEKMIRDIMNRLKFPKEMTSKVTLLVREHMFVYDPEAVTQKGVRRLISRVREENIDDLIKLREADRIGSGVPKAQPYRLRHLQAMIEKAKGEPVSVKQLKIDGNIMITDIGIQPGPKMGFILAALLEEVLEDPNKNTLEYLSDRTRELNTLSEEKLKEMAEKARQSADGAQKRIDDAIKEKYFVK
ncbi:MAG: HD domain-containing protein [Candidatus Colwellbacteria bacterium]|nr:HD domain-containing protein [Candidatus Colwellbacteria bacterium]